MNFYEIMSTKAKNLHYLKKYLRFIERCRLSNKELPPDIYTENHHVAPKASDLFPDLARESKNYITLTARQHIIAHVMLWKCFGGSQTFALDCILNKFNSDTNELLEERKVPKSIRVRYEASLRESLSEYKSEIRKGKAVYKNPLTGEKMLLDTSDPLIQELGLVGNNQGLSLNHTEEGVYNNWLAHTKITLHFMGTKIRIPFNSEEFQTKVPIMLEQGWVTYITPEDRDYVLKKVGAENSRRLKGRSRMMTKDGVYVGWFDREAQSDIISELDLIPQWTENNQRQIKERVRLATEAKLGARTYNNGEIEIKRKEHPGEGWVLGELPKSDEIKNKRANALREKTKGKILWNDGVSYYHLSPGEPPGEGWVRGVIKRTDRKPRSPKTVFTCNDGVVEIKVPLGDPIPEGFTKGKLKKIRVNQ